MSLIEQTLEQFMATGEGTQSFEAWYRAKNAKSPKNCPLTLWSDEWFEEFGLYALDQAWLKALEAKLPIA